MESENDFKLIINVTIKTLPDLSGKTQVFYKYKVIFKFISIGQQTKNSVFGTVIYSVLFQYNFPNIWTHSHIF